MITWREEGFLVAARPHGETSAIITVLTANHGLHKGVVRGGGGARMAPVLQPGAQLDVTWRARLPAHLGHFAIEPVRSRAHLAMRSRIALAGLNALCAMLNFASPEGEADSDLYQRTFELAELLGRDDLWALAYMQWEMALLERSGFGLDLSKCAVTGGDEDLAYISPRSGRAVARDAAGEWAARLLPLPAALAGGDDGPKEIAEALWVLGHFWDQKVAAALHRRVPGARDRLIEAIKSSQ